MCHIGSRHEALPDWASIAAAAKLSRARAGGRPGSAGKRADTCRLASRHFADKREVFFDGEAQLRDLLTGAVAAAPTGTRPLPALRAAFHQAVPLIERNLPVTERRMPVIVATPALQERALAKSEALVAALTDALQARGVAEPLAALCAQPPAPAGRPGRRLACGDTPS